MKLLPTATRGDRFPQGKTTLNTLWYCSIIPLIEPVIGSCQPFCPFDSSNCSISLFPKWKPSLGLILTVTHWLSKWYSAIFSAKKKIKLIILTMTGKLIHVTL